MNNPGQKLAITLTAALLVGAGVSIDRPFALFATPVRAAAPAVDASPVATGDVAVDIGALTRRVRWDRLDIAPVVEGF